MELKVGKIAKEEVYQDIVRIPEEYRRDKRKKIIREGSICRLKIGNKKIRRIVRGLQGDDAVIQLDLYTRNELNVESLDIVSVDLKKLGLLGELFWAWNATDRAYTVAARMAAMSVVFGVIGIIIAIVSLIM